MLLHLFLLLLALAWLLLVLVAFCPLRGWLRRRSEEACEKRRSLTAVKES